MYPLIHHNIPTTDLQSLSVHTSRMSLRYQNKCSFHLQVTAVLSSYNVTKKTVNFYVDVISLYLFIK